MRYKAHKNEKTGEVQTIKQHDENVAELACSFAIPVMKKIVYAGGILHDIGKYQIDFQYKLDGKSIAVEHSTCGAIVARKHYRGAAGLLLELCIAGHHSGIPDCGCKKDGPDLSTLYGRLNRQFAPYDGYQSELSIPEIDEEEFAQFLCKDCENKEEIIDKYAFLIRYVFSCLTDADSLDTERFCTGQERKPLRADFPACLEKVNRRLVSFKCTTDLQKTRAALQQQAFDKVNQDAEIYLMNMPTGSGKTLCGVKFALERAIRKKKKRIIYIIAYNSIIDQTADTFETLFGESAEILRHQSTFSLDNVQSKRAQESDEDYRKMIKQAMENWDSDFIITTAVQFFESIYGNRRGKLRKLHNMGDSILVFDEIHMIPQNYLQPCLEGITYLTRYLNSEAVFLTATMPDFASLFDKYSLKGGKILNLIGDRSCFPVFQRCRFTDLGLQGKEPVLQRAMESSASLIIVNRRQDAKELYELGYGKKYHLSTYMTAYDRRKVIAQIREELSQLEDDFPGLEYVPDDRKILVVSTSLIEAGVDLDFETVFRELAGVDNILQAAGRCNREGKRKNAVTYTFSIENDGRASGDFRSEITRGILEEFEDLSSPESIEAYYSRLFKWQEKEIVKNSMYQLCSGVETIPMREYSEKFELIDSCTVSVVVERDEESREMIQRVRFGGKADSRELQNYSCSVYLYELEELMKQGAVSDFQTGTFFLTNQDYYDEYTGLRFEGKDYIL